MKRIDVVYLDMDGVLCDFVGAAFQLAGRKYSREAYYASGHGWGIWEALSMTEDELWRIIDNKHGFWEGIPPFPWMDEVCSLAFAICSTVRILTSPHASVDCYAGKLRWWREHIEDRYNIPKPILCSEKHLLAAPGRLLLDDHDRNVQEFIKAGGEAVTMPQPWNCMRDEYAYPLAAVGMQLERLLGSV